MAKLLTAYQAARKRDKLEKQGYDASVTFVGYKARRGGGQQPMYGVSATKRKNPTRTTIRGWVKAKAVKIVRNKRGQAVSVKIRT